ncbi:MAG TPA: restriction endonuclease subunit S, partial [Pirellulaceae bacterium]|nr:restriction endonuclease subunit S [Pirellulaceae bacterium]
MSLPRYAEYKDSGVEWLGEVPAHWLITPVKHLGKLKGGAGFPHVEQGHETEELPFHKVNALGRAGSDGVLWGSENNISRATAERLGAYIFPAHALVFAKVGAALLLGRIRTLGEAACIDNNMMGLVVDNDDVDVAFVSYALNLVRFDLIANPGAVPSLNEGQIGNFPLVLPSRSEQSAIAAFLDRETGKIDALIAEQEKLLTLLAEKRQVTISHAVTRGLNPNAPMKDSGAPWLGEVLTHWDVLPIKRLGTIRYGIG